MSRLPDTFLVESLEYKDLEKMLKPEIHIDEFESKMGDNADIIVISFFVRDKQAAKDLVGWMEKGYDFIVDADMSPGEIKPSRYLVYVEIRRRTSAPQYVKEMLMDLNTLTEFEPSDWTMVYEDREVPFSEEVFAEMIPLSPAKYRKTHEGELNEMRVSAGLPTKAIYERDETIKQFQHAAGIKI